MLQPTEKVLLITLFGDKIQSLHYLSINDDEASHLMQPGSKNSIKLINIQLNKENYTFLTFQWFDGVIVTSHIAIVT